MVKGDESCSKGCGFESQRHILDGHFFTLICCKNCCVCLNGPKIKRKKSGIGPFKKRIFLAFIYCYLHSGKRLLLSVEANRLFYIKFLQRDHFGQVLKVLPHKSSPNI